MSAVAAGKALELKDVTVRFGGLTALREVSVDAEQGEIVGLIGPNGSGKTTLLNVVTGLVRPVAGRYGSGRRRAGASASIGVCTSAWPGRSSARSLFADLSIRDHLTLAAEAKHIWRRAEARSRTRRSETVDVEAMLRSEPWNLNLNWLVGGLPLGGTRAVELAMALVVPPRVLLLDEPLSGLDPIERDAFASTLRDIRSRLGVTVVLVEHDVESVVRLADRLVVLDFGVKLADGPTSEILTNTKVREAYFGSGELV